MRHLNRDEIEGLVVECITQLNEQREAEAALEVGADAPIFSDESPLDSLGLVTLTMDIEDALADQGAEVNLSDAEAMSRMRSPYRSVSTLVDFIEEQIQQREADEG